MESADKKVALITGANKGIGFEIARQLGVQGIKVGIGSRDAERGQVATQSLIDLGIDAFHVKLEVTNEEDVAALPGFFEQKFGRLDILINNAGAFTESAGVTREAFRAGYESNVIAPYFVSEALLPLLQSSPAGRIVNHSSILGSLQFNGSGQLTNEWLAPIYNSGKAALNMLTVQLAVKTKGTALKVNAAHPGSVKTDMNPHGSLTVEEGAKTAVWLATLPADGPTGGFFHMQENLPW